jgi:HECT-like Ubiquitin-conjugating enzyme (E2)-binding/MYND finger
MGRCQQCLVESHKLLRCSQCRKVHYCSATCQRKDWKKHRPDCNRKDDASFQVRLLNSGRSTVHVTEMLDDAHLNDDKLHRVDDNFDDKVDNTDAQKIANINTAGFSSEPDKNNLDRHLQNVLEKLLWSIYVEDMERLFCYQLLFRPKNNVNEKLKVHDISFSLRRSNPYDVKRHTIHFSYPLPGCPQPVQEIAIEFPRSIIPDSHHVLLVDDDEAISIRISYARIKDINICFDVRSLQQLSIDDVKNIRCRNCNETICTQTISKVLPLPSGQFDEMEDYFMCYGGEQATHFSTSAMSAQSGTVLEDEISLIMHQEDCQDALCVLSTVGYGEDFESSSKGKHGIVEEQSSLLSLDLDSDNTGPMLRGMRQWHDRVGGMTLTCSLCSSVLGFSPHDLPDTYRLLKHRLVNPMPFATKAPLVVLKESFPSISGFLVHEMIRYAETQAVFAFDVMTAYDEFLPQPEINVLGHNCLRLRLLGWDSISCDTDDFVVNAHGNFSISKWNRLAKVTYELLSVPRRQSNMKRHDDIWMLNNVDWCCLPNNEKDNEKVSDEKTRVGAGYATERNDKSFVRIFICPTEWDDLEIQLESSSKCLSKQTKEAIISTKLGSSIENSRSVGLACLRL